MREGSGGGSEVPATTCWHSRRCQHHRHYRHPRLLCTWQPDRSQHTNVIRDPSLSPPQTLFKIFPPFRIQTRSSLTLSYLKTLLSFTPTSLFPKLHPLTTRPSFICQTYQLFPAPFAQAETAWRSSLIYTSAPSQVVSPSGSLPRPVYTRQIIQNRILNQWSTCHGGDFVLIFLSVDV